MSEYPDNAYIIKTEIKKQQKHLSNNEVLEIISKYKAGKSTYELAKEYGCHRRTISDNLKKRGIKVTNQLMERKGVVELVMQMYSEYYKPADIAKAVGVNVDSVRKILKENNVYIRKSWEYPRKWKNTKEVPAVGALHPVQELRYLNDIKSKTYIRAVKVI